MIDNHQNIWKTILSTTNIVDVISEYCNLVKSGKNYKANCPFHNEKTSSFIVSPEKQIFTCFGCHKTGNAIKFLEYRLNLTPIEALKKLALKLNVDIAKIDKFKSNETQEQTELFEATEAANNLFQYQFHKYKNIDSNLINVISKRQISTDIQNHFVLGFSSNEINAFDYLQNKGFDEFVLSKISISSSTNKNINFFNNRLMFPIYDANLNCVGFSARTIDNDNVKYLNTSENDIFKKQSLFFNWNNVKENIAINKDVYLVEGQFDVIALYRIGINNALAVMGTSLTENHLSMLKKCTINLFFDGDTAGKVATIKNLKIILKNLQKYELNVKIVQNNSQNDPDEIYFSSPDGAKLKEITENKVGYLDYIYNLIFENSNYDTSLEHKQILLKEFNDFLKILNPYDQEILKQKAVLQNKLDINYFKNFQSTHFNNFYSNNLIINNQNDLQKRKFNKFRIRKDTPKSDFYRLVNFTITKTLTDNNYYHKLRSVILKKGKKWQKAILELNNPKKNKNIRISMTKENKWNTDKFTRDLKEFIKILDPNEKLDEVQFKDNLLKLKDFYSNENKMWEEDFNEINININDEEVIDKLITIIEKKQ
ncbi:DNA primase [Mycoplasma miroungirhinis]|uniref:DNA primase n=1 Tax=Mycoplasma miroungirhinis TaxID=754516 RepID=A0A6M4JD63_9MOLU|nr:DNA primase [Mycoplasma miroungirhinis]QJR44009.1 DNA primase [Mycoplasma miroungirhinis]